MLQYAMSLCHGCLWSSTKTSTMLTNTWVLIQYKKSSYQYRKSHCGDETVVRSSHLHNGISYTDNMSSLFWIGAGPWLQLLSFAVVNELDCNVWLIKALTLKYKQLCNLRQWLNGMQLKAIELIIFRDPGYKAWLIFFMIQGSQI